MASRAYQDKPLTKILKGYYDSADRKHLRLGQWFVNTYIEGTWSDLFLTEDDSKAVAMISQWLVDNGHTKNMPKKV